MANGGSRPVAPVRKLIAAVLGTVATFIVLFGLGMTSWAIVAFGVALVVLAVALATVQGGGRTWVIGMAQVHTVSEPPTAYAFGRCELQIVIDAPGMPPRSKKIIEPRVPVAKWPMPGQTLPVRVALDDQRHVRVLWEEVPTHAETAGLADLPPEFDDRRDELDDLLIAQDAPPWAGRDPDDGLRAPTSTGEPVTADLSDEFAGLRQERESVVMRHTPGGTIVLEGTVVEPAPASVLPRRSTTAPRPRVEEPAGVEEPVAAEPMAEADAATVGSTSDPLDVALIDDLPPPARPAPVDDVDDPRFVYVVETPGTDNDPARPDSPANPDSPADVDSAAGPDSAAGLDRQTHRHGTHPDDPSEDTDRAERHRTEDDQADDHRAEAEHADDELADDEPLIAAAPDAPISGVGLTLLVTDLARSVTFYRDRLGLLEIDGGDGNAVLASGSTRVVLREITEAVPLNRRLVHLNLEVEGIEAAYERLRASGVRFTYAPRVVNRGTKLELWAAAFRDPDGHGIALSEWRERTSTS